MSRQDELSKRRGQVGNNVSHSKRRTKTKKELNLQLKKFVVNGKKVKLRISAKTLKTIRKKGIQAAINLFAKKTKKAKG